MIFIFVNVLCHLSLRQLPRYLSQQNTKRFNVYGHYPFLRLINDPIIFMKLVMNKVDVFLFCTDEFHLSSHLSPLTSVVIGAPQMSLKQYLSTLPCLPLPSWNLQTPCLSTPCCYLPISSSVLLSLFLSLYPAELSSPCQRTLRCGHTI